MKCIDKNCGCHRRGRKLLWLIAGILLLLGGIASLIFPCPLVMPYILGALLLAAGILRIIIFCGSNNESCGYGWILAQGIVTGIGGILLILYPFLPIYAVQHVFATWLLFLSITWAVESGCVRRFGSCAWFLLLIIGIIGALIATATLLFSGLLMLSTFVYIGIFLIVEGVTEILYWILTRRLDF